jgi:hypothetical protein
MHISINAKKQPSAAYFIAIQAHLTFNYGEFAIINVTEFRNIKSIEFDTVRIYLRHKKLSLLS